VKCTSVDANDIRIFKPLSFSRCDMHCHFGTLLDPRHVRMFCSRNVVPLSSRYRHFVVCYCNYTVGGLTFIKIFIWSPCVNSSKTLYLCVWAPQLLAWFLALQWLCGLQE